MTKCPIHLKHLTSPRSIQMVKEAQSRGLDLTFDVTLNHLLWSDDALESLDTHFKLMPPLRSESTRQSLLSLLNDDQIQVLSCQHIPVLPEFKNCPIDDAEFGALGLETALIALWNLLEGMDEVKVKRIQALFNEGPRKVLGLDGNQLDINEKFSATLFNPQVEVEFTRYSFAEQVHNSPFINQKMMGQVVGICTQNQWLKG
jgi:dihydroorotase